MPAATERTRHYDPFSGFITDALGASSAMDGSVAHKVNLTLTLTGWSIQQGVDINWTDGTNEVQTITKTGTWSDGTYTLSWNGDTTSNIAYNANAAAIQAALEALTSVGSGNVSVSGGPLSTTAVVVTFQSYLGNRDVAMITIDTTNVTGTTPGAGVVQTTQGAGGTSTTSTTPSHTYASAVGSKTILIRGVDAHGVPLTTSTTITVT